MAHVYIEKISDTEFVGIEKLSNKRECRSFIFKKEELDFLCVTLINSGHNYSYVGTDQNGVRKYVNETENFSKKVVIFSLLTAIVTAVLMLVIELNTTLDELYYYERTGFIMLRILIASIVGAGLMFYTDTKKIESSLNWKDVKVHEHYIKGETGVFSRNFTYYGLTPANYIQKGKMRIKYVPRLSIHLKFVLVAMATSVLLFVPIYSFAIRGLFLDNSADSKIWFSVASILLSLSISFFCAHTIGIIPVNLINKYENTPKLKFYIRNMNR